MPAFFIRPDCVCPDTSDRPVVIAKKERYVLLHVLPFHRTLGAVSYDVSEMKAIASWTTVLMMSALALCGADPATTPSTHPAKPRKARTPLQMVRSFGIHYDERDVDKTPDYSYYMRAKLTPDQWERVCRELEGWKKEAIVTWEWPELEAKPEWWTPKSSDHITFCISKGRIDQQVKYEDGCLYYWSASH